MKLIKIKLIGFLLLLSFLVVPILFASPTVSAAEGDSCPLSGSFLGLPTWYKYLQAEEDSTGRCAPVLSGEDTEAQVNSALPIGLAVLEAMIRLAGIGAVVMIFVAGFRYITSDGNPENATAARKTEINAVIGLVIVILSVNLVSFIGNNVFK